MEKQHRTIHTNELTITRVFNAPREQVFKAWSEPERLMRWWGPKGFTAPVATIDFRVGGKYLNDMRSPEGKDYWSTGTYRQIVGPEKIVVTDSFADEDGNVVPASHYGFEGDFPLEMLVTVTFEEEKGATRMTLVHKGLPEGQMMELTRQGWNESFDKLAESLAMDASDAVEAEAMEAGASDAEASGEAEAMEAEAEKSARPQYRAEQYKAEGPPKLRRVPRGKR